MIFCVDIDGVLCRIVKLEAVMEKYRTNIGPIIEYLEAEPIPVNISKVNKIFDGGHVIVLHTARHEIDRVVTEEWLKQNRVKYHRLIMGKPKADYYIDDNGVSINDWLQTSY